MPAEGPTAPSFDAFAHANLTSLSRLAYLLTGDGEAANDLVADALLATWRRWDVVSAADNPSAYVRATVVKMSATRVRRLVRERDRMRLVAAGQSETVLGPDVAAVLDVREALTRLPRRQRECVVLRYGMGMSEADTALTLGISPGTVKSQTSKAAARLRNDLGQAGWPR